MAVERTTSTCNWLAAFQILAAFGFFYLASTSGQDMKFWLLVWAGFNCWCCGVNNGIVMERSKS